MDCLARWQIRAFSATLNHPLGSEPTTPLNNAWIDLIHASFARCDALQAMKETPDLQAFVKLYLEPFKCVFRTD
jgi:hypothetical protein